MCPLSSATGMKSRGSSRPAGRVLPADQRLGADDGAGGQLDDRLVHQPQLVRGGCAEPSSEATCRRALRGVVHLGPEDLDVRLADAFAAYIAVSASRSSRSAVCPRSPKHTPMLAAVHTVRSPTV